MNIKSGLLALCALMAAMAAILLGQSAGILYNAGTNPAATRAFAWAISLCFAAGIFAFGSARTFTKKVLPPAPPVDPARKHCRID